MKGNEARVVFFLHPVDQVKDGKVAKVEPLKNSVGIISLLVLALLLGLGVLIYLFLTPYVDPSQPEPDSKLSELRFLNAIFESSFSFLVVQPLITLLCQLDC